jgi:hypothetical protein
MLGWILSKMKSRPAITIPLLILAATSVLWFPIVGEVHVRFGDTWECECPACPRHSRLEPGPGRWFHRITPDGRKPGGSLEPPDIRRSSPSWWLTPLNPPDAPQ